MPSPEQRKKTKSFPTNPRMVSAPFTCSKAIMSRRRKEPAVMDRPGNETKLGGTRDPHPAAPGGGRLCLGGPGREGRLVIGRSRKHRGQRGRSALLYCSPGRAHRPWDNTRARKPVCPPAGRAPPLPPPRSSKRGRTTINPTAKTRLIFKIGIIDSDSPFPR